MHTENTPLTGFMNLKLKVKMARASTNFQRSFSLTGNPHGKRMRRAIKWARVLDRLVVRPGAPLFFLRSLRKRPY